MAESAQPSTNGRDPKTGQFVKGYEGGPGNPFAGKVQELRKAVFEAISPEDIQSLFRVGFDLAMSPENKAGERVQAARFVAEYAIGKPQPAEVTIGSDGAGGLTINIVREAEV